MDAGGVLEGGVKLKMLVFYSYNITISCFIPVILGIICEWRACSTAHCWHITCILSVVEVDGYRLCRCNRLSRRFLIGWRRRLRTAVAVASVAVTTLARVTHGEAVVARYVVHSL